MKRTYLILLLILPVLLIACGGGDSEPSAAAQAGEAAFREHCASCHAVVGDRRIVGPSLAGIATHAAEREPDTDAETYIRESILEPNKFLVEGYAQGSMQQNFASILSDEEVGQLVAYLMTLTDDA